MNAPLFRDPIYDGAADPVLIWNREAKEWWMIYTNRRATQEGPKFGWVWLLLRMADQPDACVYRLPTARFECGLSSAIIPTLRTARICLIGSRLGR